MELIVSLKSLLAAISVAIVALFGIQTPPVATQDAPGEAIAIETTETPQTSSMTPVVAPVPKKDPLVEAYELGKSIGYIEGKLEAIKQKASTTPPTTNPNPIIPTFPAPTQQTPAPTPAPQPEPLPTQSPAPMPSKAELKVISPISNKGIGRMYKASDEVVDETNYVELGVVLRDDNGEVIKDATVTITATDESQNKTLNGTGNVYTYYVDSAKKTAHYYPYHYEFRTPGQHTITFSANGMTESVTLEVGEADPL